MTTTWATFLSDIRSFLKDEGTTPRWSDRLIYVYTCDAVRDYSNWFPNTKRAAIVQNAEGFYTLPDDMIDLQSVEYPEGRFLKTRLPRPGQSFRTFSSPTIFWRVGNAIRLNADVSDEIYLTYGGAHDYPATSSDDTFTFTVPDGDMELLHLYVRAQCLEQTRTRQSNLDRFKRGGSRDDNPMNYEVRSLMDEYYDRIQQRSRGGVIYLYGT